MGDHFQGILFCSANLHEEFWTKSTTFLMDPSLFEQLQTQFVQIQTQIVQAKEQVESWEAKEATAKKNHEAMMNLAKHNVEALNSKMIFDVGGTLFSTTKETLMRVKDSYFTSMMESGCWAPQKDGTYFIDRSPKYFGLILDYLRYDELDMDGLTPTLKRMLQKDFDYFFPSPKVEGLLGLQRNYSIMMQNWLGKPIDTSKLLWRGSRDGFTAKAFHKRCDNQGATLTVIESTEGWIFGGYSPSAWQSPSSLELSNSEGSFLFTLKDPHGTPPTQYMCTRDSVVCSCASHGPMFGKDLVVRFALKSETNFPTYYKDTTGFGNATFTGDKTFEVKEIEVYSV